MTLHLVKLCVGAESVEALRRYQAARAKLEHVTRMMPVRRAELLDGGSLYWVIGGDIRVRQRLLGVEPVRDAEGTPRCRLVLDRELVLTQPWPRRPFQGWRYLEPSSAPADLAGSGSDELPEALRADLAALGLL